SIGGSGRPAARGPRRQRAPRRACSKRRKARRAMRTGVLLGAWFMLATTPIAAAPPIVSSVQIPTSPAPPVSAAAPSPRPAKPDLAARLTAALPTDGTADVVLIDWPAAPGTPHVRAATAVAAAPAAIRTVLLDAANYRKIVPSLIRADVSRTPAGLPSV